MAFHMEYTYLDWAATAPPDEEALDVFKKTALQYPGNPSSLHEIGRQAAAALKDIRKGFARLLSCPENAVVITGSGTESNNIVFSSLPVLYQMGERKKTVVISGIEHASVYEPAQLLKSFGFTVVTVPAEEDGGVRTEKLLGFIDESAVLVAVMHVNNETGAIQPVEEMARAIREKSARFMGKIHIHVDAVQSFGKLPFFPAAWDIDSASASGHKLGAPKGAGLLYLKRPIPVLYRGGEQEAGIRPGTENVAAAAAFLKSAESCFSAMATRIAHAESIRDYLLEKTIDLPGLKLLPGYAPSLYSPYIVPLFFPPIPGEVLTRFLNEERVAVSFGSACSGKKKGRSRVLEAMGLAKPMALSATRISTGPATSYAHIDALIDALKRMLPKLLA